MFGKGLMGRASKRSMGKRFASPSPYRCGCTKATKAIWSHRGLCAEHDGSFDPSQREECGGLVHRAQVPCHLQANGNYLQELRVSSQTPFPGKGFTWRPLTCFEQSLKATAFKGFWLQLWVFSITRERRTREGSRTHRLTV